MCLPDSYLWYLFLSLPFECKHPKRQSCLPFSGNYIFLLIAWGWTFIMFILTVWYTSGLGRKTGIQMSFYSLLYCSFSFLFGQMYMYSFIYCRKEQSIYIYVMIIFHNKEAHCMSLDRYMLLSFTLKYINISWYILYSIFNFDIIVHVYYSYINTVHRNF